MELMYRLTNPPNLTLIKFNEYQSLTTSMEYYQLTKTVLLSAYSFEYTTTVSTIATCS